MTHRLALALVVTALTLTAAPLSPALACGGYDEIVPLSPVALVRQHYAAMRTRNAASLAQVWHPDAVYAFDSRGCCAPPRMPLRPILLGEMGDPHALVVESVAAPQVNGDSAAVTATVRRGTQHYQEHFSLTRVGGAWSLTRLIRSAARA